MKVVKAGKCTSTVQEEPLRDKPIWVRVHKHRLYCKSCKRRSTESIDGIWPRRRTTQRFRKFIAKSCANMSDLSRVSRIYGVSQGFCYQVYYEQVEVKLREKGKLLWPEVLGVDEHFFRRKQGITEFVSVFTDLKKRRVMEMVKGKDTLSLTKALEEVEAKSRVKLVVMDLSGGYRSFVKKMFPEARIIADKFHVLRLFSPMLMKKGKEIHGHRQNLKIRRYLCRSRVKLDYWKRAEIDRYLENHPELREIYRFKEKLYEIYRTRGKDKIERAWQRMLEEMKCSLQPELQRLRRTLKKWEKEILGYFENRYTNAFTERMNGTGKLVQRRAFGYKSFKNYRLRFLSACHSKVF